MITKEPPYDEHVHVKTPFKHQLEIFEKTRSLACYALYWEMGTGKTKPLIDTIAWLFLNKEIDGALIVADKGSYMNWPMTEIPAHLQPDVMARTRIGWWSSYARAAQVQAMKRVMIPKDDVLDLMFVNVEALSSNKAVDACQQFLKNHYTMMIIDEATSIKSPNAARTVNACRLGQMCDFRRIATGTPITQGPMDIYSQAHFLEPGILGHRSFSSFKSEFAVEREIIMGTRRFRTIVGYRNLARLSENIKKFSSRILKSECLDLPEKLYEVLHVDMSEQQRRIYDQVKNEALSMVDSSPLTVTNAMAAVEKLHQVCCGHVKDDAGVIRDLEHGRLEALISLIEQISGKVIIWCNYQRDVENVMRVLTSHGAKAGDFPVHYYGKTTQDQRLMNLDMFVNNPKCKWFVGTAATGGKSLTLVVASFVVYYSCGYKLEARLQSEDRAHRIGQRNPVTYVDMICRKTVEVKILQALKSKRELAHEILDSSRFRSLLTEEDDLEY